MFCISDQILVVLAWMGDGLLRGQAEMGLNLNFGVKFDLECQDQSPHKIIGIFYTWNPNLVILAWTGDELSRGQAHDWGIHGHTHRRTQPAKIPGGQLWWKCSTLMYFSLSSCFCGWWLVHFANVVVIFNHVGGFSSTMSEYYWIWDFVQHVSLGIVPSSLSYPFCSQYL